MRKSSKRKLYKYDNIMIMSPLKIFLIVYVTVLLVVIVLRIKSNDLETFQERLELVMFVLKLSLIGVLLFLTYKLLDFFFLSNPFL